MPFTVGQSRFSDLYSHQFQFADTLSWSLGKHSFRFGTSVARHTSGGTGSEPGTAVLGTFTFKPATTAPLDQLTLDDVQSYTQPIDFGIHSYDLKQWLVAVFAQDSLRPHPDVTVDVGLRYDLQTLTDATTNISPRVGFGWHPGGDARTSVRGGYGMYYTQIRSNAVASYLVNGLDGLTTYTAVPGQFGFPTCLTCVPIAFDPRALPPSQLPARDITIQAGQADFYRAQFARYGLNFDLLPNYPDKLVNPRSQVISIGGERDLGKGLLLAADYVHQRLDNIDRTVDLNAPTPFDRTAPGQVRSVAAANATRPILPVNGGVRQVNVLMNLGEAEYNALQTQLRYRNPKLEALVTLHALEGDQHDRARRQRHRPQRRQHRAPGRRGARTERRGPAPPRRRVARLPPPLRHLDRRPGPVRVGAPVQRHHGRGQQRRRSQQRPPRRQRAGPFQVRFPREHDPAGGRLHRRAGEGRRGRVRDSPRRGLQPLQSRKLPGPRPDDLWQRGGAGRDVRAARRRGHLLLRDPGLRQRGPAPHVPVLGPLRLLTDPLARGAARSPGFFPDARPGLDRIAGRLEK